jgi:hypothetical protein
MFPDFKEFTYIPHNYYPRRFATSYYAINTNIHTSVTDGLLVVVGVELLIPVFPICILANF